MEEEKQINMFENLHREAIYLKGARDLLLLLERMGCGIRVTDKGDKFANVYNTAVMQELINNRESLKKFLCCSGWRYYDHKRDKKNKLVSVKIKFDD